MKIQTLCHRRETNSGSPANKISALTTAPWELRCLHSPIILIENYPIIFFVSREPVLSAVNWANESVVAAWVNRVQNRARITRCSINEGVCDVVSLTRTLCNWLKRRIFKLL